VKVRSSPTASTPEAAAGDFPTYLNVEGIEQLKRAVKACWAAVFTSAAIKYRTENNFSHSDVYNPVIVQKMVQSEKSGIVLTSNPENRNEMPISALRGYSIGLNEFRPSKYIIDKKSNKVIRKDEVEQIYGYFGAAKGRSVKKELPFSVISEPVLSDLEIIRLSNIANEIESEFRRDFIIEFAIEDERTFITDLKEIKEVQMKFKAKDEEIDEESEDIEDSKGKEIEEDIDEDIEEDTEEETKEHAEEETEEDIEETEEDTEETEKKTEDEYESDEDLMDDDRSKDLSDEEDDSELEDDKSGELEADEEEADKEESDSDFDEEAEKEEADDGQSEDSNDDDEKEEKLNELFEEYSEKINQLLGELKEESLRILRE
jgi:phosphoenolpyruvate synthase/pyruvate phosphate dikinase